MHMHTMQEILFVCIEITKVRHHFNIALLIKYQNPSETKQSLPRLIPIRMQASIKNEILECLNRRTIRSINSVF